MDFEMVGVSSQGNKSALGRVTLVLKNGIEVKLQRNALSVLESLMGNKKDDELDLSSGSSDLGVKDRDLGSIESPKGGWPRVRLARPWAPSLAAEAKNNNCFEEFQTTTILLGGIVPNGAFTAVGSRLRGSQPSIPSVWVHHPGYHVLWVLLRLNTAKSFFNIANSSLVIGKVLKNGIEVKLQRNAFSVLKSLMGNKKDDELDLSSGSSDLELMIVILVALSPPKGAGRECALQGHGLHL